MCARTSQEVELLSRVICTFAPLPNNAKWPFEKVKATQISPSSAYDLLCPTSLSTLSNIKLLDFKLNG